MSSQVLDKIPDLEAKSGYNNMSNFQIKNMVIDRNKNLGKMKFPRTNMWDDVNVKNSKYSKIMLTNRTV